MGRSPKHPKKKNDKPTAAAQPLTQVTACAPPQPDVAAPSGKSAATGNSTKSTGMKIRFCPRGLDPSGPIKGGDGEKGQTRSKGGNEDPETVAKLQQLARSLSTARSAAAAPDSPRVIPAQSREQKATRKFTDQPPIGSATRAIQVDIDRRGFLPEYRVGPHHSNAHDQGLAKGHGHGESRGNGQATRPKIKRDQATERSTNSHMDVAPTRPTEHQSTGGKPDVGPRNAMPYAAAAKGQGRAALERSDNVASTAANDKVSVLPGDIRDLSEDEGDLSVSLDESALSSSMNEHIITPAFASPGQVVQGFPDSKSANDKEKKSPKTASESKKRALLSLLDSLGGEQVPFSSREQPFVAPIGHGRPGVPTPQPRRALCSQWSPLSKGPSIVEQVANELRRRASGTIWNEFSDESHQVPALQSKEAGLAAPYAWSHPRMDHSLGQPCHLSHPVRGPPAEWFYSPAIARPLLAVKYPHQHVEFTTTPPRFGDPNDPKLTLIEDPGYAPHLARLDPIRNGHVFEIPAPARHDEHAPGVQTEAETDIAAKGTLPAWKPAPYVHQGPHDWKEGDWICPDPKCNYHNFARNAACRSYGCGMRKPEDAGRQGRSSPDLPLGTVGDWRCIDCKVINWRRRLVCVNCIGEIIGYCPIRRCLIYGRPGKHRPGQSRSKPRSGSHGSDGSHCTHGSSEIHESIWSLSALSNCTPPLITPTRRQVDMPPRFRDQDQKQNHDQNQNAFPPRTFAKSPAMWNSPDALWHGMPVQIGVVNNLPPAGQSWGQMWRDGVVSRKAEEGTI